MKEFLKENFLFIFYSLISITILNIFFYAVIPSNGNDSIATSIFNEEHLNESMIDEAVNQGHGNTTNEFGYFEKIDEINVYFNVKGRTLDYAPNYNWKDFIKFKDSENPEGFINDDGSENIENDHCLAVIKFHNIKTGQTRIEHVDLTSFVTPANYTNEHPIPMFDYLNETPTEAEAQIEIVPYVLNWENIHIKKNVAYFILPKSALLTFTGKALSPSGQPFVNKRIVFYKGDKEMAVSDTNSSGDFVIGINTPKQTGGVSTEHLMPLGDYKFVISAEGKKYNVVYPENTWTIEHGDKKTISVGTVTFNEGE